MARRKGPNKAGEGAAPKPARSKKGAAEPGTMIVPPAQVASADQMREAMDRLIDADKAAKAAKNASNSKTSGYRAIFKEAVKTTGFSNDAISWFIENRERSPQDIDAETRDRNRVAKFMNMPIGGQLGLLDDGSSVASGTDKENNARLDNDVGVQAAAEAQGMEAGEGGANFGANPFPAGSKRAAKWGSGWKLGNSKNAPGQTKQPTHESAHA